MTRLGDLVHRAALKSRAAGDVEVVQTEVGLFVPKSLVDGKGDLLVGSADDVLARLGIGTDGQVLQADAAQALGLKWAAAPYDSAQTLALLRALSAQTADKVKWQSSGEDVVEVWGDEVSLPTAVLATFFADNFTTDTLADPTKWTKITTGVNAAWVDDYFSTDHGAYQNTNPSIIGYQCLTNPRTADREVRMHYSGRWDQMRNAGVFVSKFSLTDIIGVNVSTNNVGPDPDWMALNISAFNATTASTTTLASTVGWSAPVPDGTSAHWWLVGRKVGNTITAEVYTVDPAIAGATPYVSVSHVLSAAVSTRGSGGTDAGNHGAGVNNPVGYANGQQNNQATSHNYGEFKILDTGSATHRRLMAAVTPTAGPRVQFPIFDLLPSGAGTSPINLQEVNTTGLSDAQIDALLSYAAINGILLSDPTNKTVLIRQVNAWTKMAPLASPAFTGSPTAPTQASGDGTTKIATDAYADRIGQQVFGINTQAGTAYTAVLTDAGKVIESNNGGAMTLTIPPNSGVAFPVNTRLRGVRVGAGTLTIVQGAGVVLRNRIEAAGTTNRTVSAQYGTWEAYKRATDEWVLSGDLA